jgi:hypothetical protein
MSLLSILPAEIRIKIFKYVFTTTIGGIILVPVPTISPCLQYTIVTIDPPANNRISLARLRTCKQFYKECRNLIWECNKLYLGPRPWPADLELLRKVKQAGGSMEMYLSSVEARDRSEELWTCYQGLPPPSEYGHGANGCSDYDY